MLAMPASRDLPPQTATSLAATANLLTAKGVEFELNMVVGGSIVTAVRTKTAHNFLQSDKNRLFWFDSDIVWEPDDALKLIALSTKMECVGAMYPTKEIPSRFLLGRLDLSRIVMNELGCFEHCGMGLGFTCVTRSVMEQLAEKAPKLVFPGDGPIPSIFRLGQKPSLNYPGYDDFQGEDMAFFEDVQALGVKTYCDPSIRLGHVGPHIHWGRMMDFMKKEADASRSEREEVSGETSVRVLSEGPQPPEAPLHTGAHESSTWNCN